MKRTWICFAVALGMLLAREAFAKAYFAGKAEMIQKADAIVVVNVEWFKDDKALFEMAPKPLPDVIKEIESILKEKAPHTAPETTP